MPQRRAYAPTPMNAPQTGPTGRQQTPPNLAQAPQQNPPMPSMPPQGPMALTPAPANGAAPMMTGMTGPNETAPAPNIPGTSTVGPFNVSPFLKPEQTMNDPTRPTSSATTSKDAEGPYFDHNAQVPDDQDQSQVPMALLKMMGILGR